MPNMKKKLEKKLLKNRPGYEKKAKSQSALETQSDFDDSLREQSDHELSGLEQSDQELSGNDESDPRLSRAEKSYLEQSWAEQSEAEQPGEEQSGEEQSGEEESEEEQSDLEQSGAERVAEKHLSLQRPATPPRLDELLSSEAIGEGTVADRKREFLLRLAAFTERIYKPDGRVNYCKFCKKTYSTNRNFWVHMETMHKEKKKFHCKKCNKKFSMQSLLRRHQTYFCEDAFKCNLCRKVCSSTEELKEHKLMDHKRTEKCDACCKYFSTKRNLIVHKRINQSEKPFVCTVEGCEESFQLKRQREWHLVQKHGPKKKNTTQKGPFLYLCPDCGKEIKHRQSVKPHQRMHARGLKPKAPKKEAYPCKVCNEEFLMRKDLVIHIRTVHNTHKCTYCNLMFPSKAALGRHLFMTHSIYRCKLCKAEFGSKTEGIQHRFTVHGLQAKTGDGYTCNLCNTKAKTSVELTEHKKVVHSVYRCFKCMLEFNSSYARKTHYKKEHRDTKSNFPCKHCNQTFSTQSRCYEHIKFMHKGYRCGACDIVFPQGYALVRHRRLMHPKPTGTGVKLVTCSDCSSVFQSEHEKRRHRKIMHPRPDNLVANNEGSIAARTLPVVGSQGLEDKLPGVWAIMCN